MDILEEIGKYFGYPACCIKAFDVIVQNSGIKTFEQSHPDVHKGTGFIPCPSHAHQILLGAITLESLINNRVCPLPFPQEDSMEDLDKHLQSIEEKEESYI